MSGKPAIPIKPRTALPPAAFSNAMNELLPGWNAVGWQTSGPWKLWLAGVKEGTKISAWGCEEAYEEMARKAKVR